MSQKKQGQGLMKGTPEERRQERARRIFLAHNAIERKLGRKVSFAALGEMVAKLEGRLTSDGRVAGYSSGNVQRWESGEKAAGIDAMEALEILAGFPPGYIAYALGREQVEEAPGEHPAVGRLEFRATPTTRPTKHDEASPRVPATRPTRAR